ncbi:MAG: hypothetical protein QG670_1752 [Thermoproteota archaeon]|nr:hypothetical protein [Thermoproteota archaeon]
MDSTPEEIASLWQEQMQRGYLKLAILFALTKGSLHGYHMMKRINELTLGMIKPTAGGMYPTLKELEKKGLVKGAWHHEERRKVYTITERGKEVFREVVEKHLDMASSVRSWILNSLTEFKIIEKAEMPMTFMPAIRLLLLSGDASIEEKIEALKRLKKELQNLTLMLNTMAEHVEDRIDELRTNKIQDIVQTKSVR